MKNKMIKRVRNLSKAALAAAGMTAISAHAALPAGVTTVLTDATTDIVTLGAAALLLAGTAFGIFALYKRVPRS